MPDKVPVSIDKSDMKLRHRTFMVVDDFTLGRFQLMVRRKCLAEPLAPETAIYLMVHTQDPNKPLALCSASTTIASLFDQYKNAQNVLVFDVKGENVFG